MAITFNGKVEFEGRVIGHGTSYIGDGDSLAYALVFNAETQEVERVGYGYAPTSAQFEADVDEDVIATLAHKARLAMATSAYNYAVMQMREIEKWDTVEVVRGRKVAVGTVAKVAWMGENQWGKSVGLIVDDQMVFTAFHNVEKVVSDEALSEAALKAWDEVAEMDNATAVRRHYHVYR